MRGFCLAHILTRKYNNSMKKLDFLAIGDVVIDAFIELEDASVHCDIDNANCTLSMKFADKIPYKDVTIVNAVGNSPNAATSAARLGLTSALVASVGNDQNGKDCLETLRGNGVDTSFIQVENGVKTNYHYVLMYGADRTILVKHEPFTCKFPALETAPSWIYLSSIAAHTEKYHDEIADYLEANPEVKLTFQPGTFQMKLGVARLARIYARTEIFVCNVEEAQRILDSKEADVKVLMSEIHKFGPKIVVITDGPKGAYASDGTNAWFMPIYPDPKAPISRTGAGDAYASTFTSAIALGKSIEEALSWAPINSMNVVQYVGAQKGLLTREQLEEYLAKAPEDYKPRRI